MSARSRPRTRGEKRLPCPSIWSQCRGRCPRVSHSTIGHEIRDHRKNIKGRRPPVTECRSPVARKVDFRPRPFISRPSRGAGVHLARRNNPVPTYRAPASGALPFPSAIGLVIPGNAHVVHLAPSPPWPPRTIPGWSRSNVCSPLRSYPSQRLGRNLAPGVAELCPQSQRRHERSSPRPPAHSATPCRAHRHRQLQNPAALTGRRHVRGASLRCPGQPWRASRIRRVAEKRRIGGAKSRTGASCRSRQYWSRLRGSPAEIRGIAWIWPKILPAHAAYAGESCRHVRRNDARLVELSARRCVSASGAIGFSNGEKPAGNDGAHLVPGDTRSIRPDPSTSGRERARSASFFRPTRQDLLARAARPPCRV